MLLLLVKSDTFWSMPNIGVVAVDVDNIPIGGNGLNGIIIYVSFLGVGPFFIFIS